MIKLALWVTMTLLAFTTSDARAVETHGTPASPALQRRVTTARCGHILTNTNVWSPDSRWLVYDVRSDPSGTDFDGSRIERVNVETGRVELLYESARGAHCGVASCCPTDDHVIFIQGPENPTPDWSYSPSHRAGSIVRVSVPGLARNLDARDLQPPFTAGALRGGTHLHIFDGAGQWVGFTYEDALLSRFTDETAEQDVNLRAIGVSVPNHPVTVPRTSPRNRDGDYFSVLVTALHGHPRPGSDEIKRASEEGWVGRNGYLRADQTRQQHAIAFQGQVVTASGATIAEVFIVDLPEDLTVAGDGPLQGTETRRPAPPRGCVQRRLTHTENRKYPGLQGPRHWVHSSPDGSRIAFLMKDDAGVVQIWAVSPNGGPIAQITHNSQSVASAFSWSPDGHAMAYVMDNSVVLTDVATGITWRLTARSSDEDAPRPEACVISPDGRSVAFVRQVPDGPERFNQIFVVNCQ